MAWDKNEEYYTGQGTVLMAKRDADGKPLGFRHFGNVASLGIATARNYNVHKESKTGKRSTDRRTISETNVTLSAACENFSSENIAQYTNGLLTKVTAGSVTDVAYNGYGGLVTAFDHIKISAVAVKIGTQALVAYTNSQAPWDFKVNPDHGSILLNADGANVVAAVTDIVVGASTTITADIGYVEVGDVVKVTGVTGADANIINGVALTVKAVTGTGIVVDLNTTGKTIVGTSAKLHGVGVHLLVSYAYQAQDLVDALAVQEEEVYLRFEGLNTAEGDEPVVIEIFRVGIAPIAELALFGDAVQQATITAEVFSDPHRTTGSKFYSVKKLGRPETIVG